MCPNIQETVNLVTFTNKVVKEKLHILCSNVMIYFSNYLDLFPNFNEGEHKFIPQNSARTQQMFFKIAVLKSLANSIGKHLCWS